MTSRLPQDTDLDLTLFVACYNEERNIADTLRTVLSALEAYSFSWEIIVIDEPKKLLKKGQTLEEYFVEKVRTKK